MSLTPGTKTYANHVRETTRWEDILVEKNIVRADEGLERHKAAVEQAKQRGEQEDFSLAQKLNVIRLHGTDDILAALEDDLVQDEDDERVMLQYRQARRLEMKQQLDENKFGSLEQLARDEFVHKVKLASQNEGVGGKPVYVVVELFKEGIPKSELTTRAVQRLCREHLNVKFVRMVSDQCIEAWPDANVPSVFVYYDGEAVRQLIGFEQCGQGDASKLERILCGVIKSAKPKLTTLFVGDAAREDDDDVDDKEDDGGGGGGRRGGVRGPVKAKRGVDDDEF